MNITEFKNRVDQLLDRGWDDNFTDEDFANVNLVYTYHPMISATNGKHQIARLYATGLMGIINDMCKTAAALANCETTLQTNTVAMENLKKEHQREIQVLLDRFIDEKQLICDDSNRVYLLSEAIKKPFVMKINLGGLNGN